MFTIDINENNSFFFRDTSLNEPAEGEICIAVHASGVNRADLLQKAGMYNAPKSDSPILGLEVAGVVSAIGSGVSSFKVGDKVMALCAGGGYSESVNVDARHCLPLPDYFSFEQGAGFCETFYTAFDAMRQHPDLGSHSSILVHAGASGVGTAAIALAKAKNMTVVVTVGSDEKAQFCEQLGADLAINYKTQNWREVLKEQGIKVDLIIDPVASHYTNDNISALAMDGRIVVLALLGGRYVEQFDMARMLQKRAHLIGSTLRNRSADYKAQLVSELKHTIADELARERIVVEVDKVFAYRDVQLAHDYVAANKNRGKVILSNDH